MARRKLASEINVVPYIDVMLVLLIIFMITAPLLTQGVQVDLPKTNAETITQDEKTLTLTVDGQGRYYLSVGDTHRPVTEDDIMREVGIVMRNNPGELVLVDADKRVPYQYVAQAMSILQQAGVPKIGFVTNPADLKPTHQ
ncbi:MAG: protein TolR [Stenotrophobium sp.]